MWVMKMRMSTGHLFTSNFGATVELDQKVYDLTDTVHITITSLDHNFDTDLIDEIGWTDLEPIKISTRGFELDNYKLVETGVNTGCFSRRSGSGSCI